MRVSIITVCYNSEKFIEECIQSVLSQDYQNIEYIVVDGKSTDRTLDIISRYKDKITKIISEEDDGLYDAMNKGIVASTGEIVGILNSDDLFNDKSCVQEVVKAFNNIEVECVFANLTFFKKDRKSITRLYDSKKFKLRHFLSGDAPAHPTFYTRKHNFEKFGYYSTRHPVAADFDLMLRFLYIEKLKYQFIDKVIVNMREGGKSTRNLLTYIVNNREKYDILKRNKLTASYVKLMSRYIFKIRQLLVR